MKIGEAVSALGVEEPDDRDLCIVWFDDEGRTLHHTLREVRDLEIPERDVYLTSGAFRRGSIQRFGGRTRDNVAEVLWLPFDADLSDCFGVEKRWLHDYPQPDLDDLVEDQREQVEEAFRRVGVPIHRLDYTGYGLCAYVRVAPDIAGHVDDLRGLNRRIIEQVNQIAGKQLLDPQVKDAGSRFTRLVPCANTKGSVTRISRNLYQREGSLARQDLERFARAEQAPRPVATLIPSSPDRMLDGDDERAIVAILAPHWHQPNRHAIALGLSGMLAKAHVPEEQAERIVAELAAGDDEPFDRQRCVHTTYDTVRAGLDVQGYRTLERLLPAEAMAAVARPIEAIRQATAPRIQRFSGSDEPARETVDDRWSFDPPPDVAFRGWFGRYLSVVAPTTEAPDAFHLGCSLVYAGALTDRRIWIDYGRPTYLNFFCLLIGAAGSSRKDTAMDRADRYQYLPSEPGSLANLPYQVVRGTGSTAGFLRALQASPNLVLALSEYDAFLEVIKRDYASDLATQMLTLFDCKPVVSLLKADGVDIPHPFLSFLAAIQPQILAAQMSTNKTASGFVSRWLHFPGHAKDPIPRPPLIDRRGMFHLYQDLDASYRRCIAECRGRGMVLTVGAERMWDEWYVRDRDNAGRTEMEDEARTRRPVYAQKLAALYAATEGRASVNEEDLDAAIRVVEWSWSQLMVLIPEWGSSPNNKLSSAIERALAKRGPITRRELQQATRNPQWDAIAFKRVLDAMLDIGQVETDGKLIALPSQIRRMP